MTTVCAKCGGIASREARFCQEGHALVRKCVHKECNSEFPIEHLRCDFCGRRQQLPQLHEIYEGTITYVHPALVDVDILDSHAILWVYDIANHDVADAREELKVGQQIRVKVIEIIWETAIPQIRVSSKVLGRP